MVEWIFDGEFAEGTDVVVDLRLAGLGHRDSRVHSSPRVRA